MKNWIQIVLVMILHFSVLSQTGNISGTIISPNGDPETGAIITLDSINKVRSDYDGNFKIDSVQYGEHVLWVWNHKYPDTTKITFNIISDTTTYFEIHFPECHYQRDSNICPVCAKNDEVIRIVYGYPGGKLIESAKEGKVRLGGCVVSYCDPYWFCKRDELSF